MAATRPRTPVGDVSAVLLAAAGRAVEAGGPDAVTVREVARDAGVAPMGVYSRFGGKDGLLVALAAQGFDELVEAIRGARGPDALSRLAAACAAYRRHAVAHPQHYRLMVDEMARDASGPVRIAAGRAFDELVARVEDAQAAGALAPGDPHTAASQLWSAAHGAVALEIAGLVRVPDPAAAYEGLVRALLRGLS